MSQAEDPPIRVTVLDTQTGRRVDDRRFSAWWWAEGNGSCDCNRELIVQMKVPEGPGVCLGCQRYLIISAPADCGYSLRELNEGYPEDLLEAHLRDGIGGTA